MFFSSFYRGCIPPLWGSMIYRGVMISSYEYAVTWFENHTNDDSIFKKPIFLGLRPLIPVSTLFAAVARGIIESPIEYAKVMGQTGQKWQIKDIYRGFHLQIFRTCALLVPIFSTLDIFRRNTDVLSNFTGNFLVQAGASGAAYLMCWPLETLKNLSQSGMPMYEGSIIHTALCITHVSVIFIYLGTPRPGATFRETLAYLGGPWGLFRGVWPGTLCGALRNGCAMVMMVQAQGWATKLGLRQKQ